jgi:hypothetical protein
LPRSRSPATRHPEVRIEPFNVYLPNLSASVKLPGIGAEDPAFWPKQPRRLTMAEIYVRN